MTMLPPNTPTFPLQAFFKQAVPIDGSDPPPLFGRDVDSRNEFLVFGRDTLRKIIRTGRSQQASVLCIELDQATDELEALIAMIRVVRGHDDYEPYPRYQRRPKR